MRQTSQIDELFSETLKYIRSPTFRTPIKNYVDANCSSFREGESLVEHNQIHIQFKELINNLLEQMLKTLQINESTFLKIAMQGLNHDKYKKYFEQIIACDNFVYFNCMMIKRNSILTGDTMKLMDKHMNDNTHNYKEEIAKHEEIKASNEIQMNKIVQEKHEEIKKTLPDSPIKKHESSPQRKPIDPQEEKKKAEEEARRKEEERKKIEEEKKKIEENAKIKEIERKRIEAEMELKMKKDLEDQLQQKQEMEKKIRETNNEKEKKEIETKYNDLKSQKDKQLEEYRKMMANLKAEKRNLQSMATVKK